MTKMNLKMSLLVIPVLLAGGVRAEDQADSMMKAAAVDAGRMNNAETGLYEQSIKTTKQSIARETLEVFYHDALDYYHDRRYADAQELLDKIYSIDPHYEDVSTLRETVHRLQVSSDRASKRDIIDGYMAKGNQAFAAGQSVAAINFWKQALAVDPDYAPAKKKIHDVNSLLAKRQFEEGYMNYHRGNYEDALDSWSNAIALDPSYKQRGLLVLMSKIQINVERDRTSRLASMGFDAFQQGNLPGALSAYQELLKFEPRHEEARRMTAKIKFQLGQTAFKAGRTALGQGLYAEAIKQWETSASYGFEVQRSQDAIKEAEAQMRRANAPRPKPKPVEAAPAAAPVLAAPVAPAAPVQASDPAGAMNHYRQGLAAIRAKDYKRAVDELNLAKQLDPNNERIYIALQRAEQEWKQLNANGAGAS